MSNTTPRALENYKYTWDDHIKRTRSQIVDGYWYEKQYRKDFVEKDRDFKHSQKRAEDLVEALSVLLGEVDGYRNKPGVQPYINYVVDAIKMHVDRIVKYGDKYDIKSHQSKEDQRKEGDFQRELFLGRRKIQDKLNELNLDNNMEHVSVTFHSEKIAAIPMKSPIEIQNYEIKAKIESLTLDWDYVKDNEMFYNYEKKDVPDWIDGKHFFDQEKETLQFYISEFNKFRKGLDIDGYFMHPWLYWHLNYFMTPVPITNDDGTKEEKIMLPPLRDNEWYFAEILKRVEKRGDCGVLIYGSRRFAKSSIIASYLMWKATISPNGNITVTGGNAQDLGDLTDKMETAMKAIHPAFKIETNKEDWTKEVEFGLKSKTNRKIKLCDARIINLDSGSSGGSQKTAGGAPVAFVIEEIGKFSWREAFDSAIPSFETLDGWKTIPLLIGTGNKEDMSTDAEKVLSNPEQNDLMEIDWDLLEWQIPKEAITWTRRPFGWFVPAQMGYKTGYKRIKRKMSDFLQIESKDLDKIDILQTDWVNNTQICRDRRKKLQSDKEKLQKEIVFYPLDPEECFMSAKNNPFPAQKIKAHKERLQSEGDEVYGTARRIELSRKNDNSVGFRLSNKEVNIYPHDGKFTDCPFLLFDDFPEKPPYDPHRFVAGHDDYKQEQSEGDSIGAFYIFDRLKRKIVLSLANRPDPHGEMHKQIHMALDAYNCKSFMENEDMDFKKYLDRVTDPSLYLYKGFDAYGDFSKFSNGTRKFGWKPDKNTVPQVRGYAIDYTKEDLEQKSEGQSDMVYGYERIEDIQLLEEMVKFKEGGNFDRLVAFGSCLAIDYYLTSNYITPQSGSQSIRKEEEQESQKPSRNKFFTKTRRNVYSSKPNW